MTDCRQVHIVGCSPRSGTTLMQEMMAGGFAFDDVCEHERSLFKPPRGSICCTKHPKEIFYVPCALKHNPALHVIYVVRDPRDVIVSHHANAASEYFTGLGFWLEAEKVAAKLEHHPRFLVINYEELVRQPDQVQGKIAAAFPFLVKKREFSNFHSRPDISEHSMLAMGGIRPPSTSSIGNWKNHLPRVAAQLRRYGDITAHLKARGYEVDGNWLTTLPASSGQDKSLMGDDENIYKRIDRFFKVRRKCFNYWLSHRAT